MTALKTTGLDNAPGIPVGATIVAATWHVAHLYGPGDAHETERDAILEGIAEKEAAVARHNAHYAGIGVTNRVPLPETITIDLRWKMTWPYRGLADPATGMTFTVRRQTYASLAEAREHLARIDRYTTEAEHRAAAGWDDVEAGEQHLRDTDPERTRT